MLCLGRGPPCHSPQHALRGDAGENFGSAGGRRAKAAVLVAYLFWEPMGCGLALPHYLPSPWSFIPSSVPLSDGPTVKANLIHAFFSLLQGSC